MVILRNFRHKYILYPAVILLALCLRQLCITITYREVLVLNKEAHDVLLSASSNPLWPHASVQHVE